MTKDDLNFAAALVRALHMVTQASREWLAAKRQETFPSKPSNEIVEEDDSQR